MRKKDREFLPYAGNRRLRADCGMRERELAAPFYAFPRRYPPFSLKSRSRLRERLFRLSKNSFFDRKEFSPCGLAE
jgi:hypothetical protein